VPSNRVERRLTAILTVDMMVYSRLMNLMKQARLNAGGLIDMSSLTYIMPNAAL
jgi:hypothetical protein